MVLVKERLLCGMIVEGSLRNSKADKTSETQWTYEGEQRWKDEVVE